MVDGAFAAQFAVMNMKWSRAVQFRAFGEGPTEHGADDIVIETHGDTWMFASTLSRPALVRFDAVVREAGVERWDVYED